MLKTNKSVPLLLLFVLLAICNRTLAQQQKNIQRETLYVFDKDSLAGFDEEAARKSAISDRFLGAEFKVKMFQYKRAFINDKYNLWPRFAPAPYSPDLSARVAVPGCTNEDFEASNSGFIASNNAITGWSLTAGTNNTLQGQNSCNLLGCCSQITSQSAIRTTPFVDARIGAQYPVYSVFGAANSNSTAAAAANPQLSTHFGGNKVIRINDSVNNYSIEKLSKTFAVSGSNALFQFAFISVFATSHPCCEAGSFRIKLYAAGSNTPLACPVFTVSAPSVDCAADAGTPNYLEAAYQLGNAGAPMTNSSAYIYNPWQISSIDLTPYIGSSITIEIILTDCNAGGHFGYCYFDAQCGPMTIYGNGTAFDAGATTATVPTCGAAGATLCAADGLGPYSWAGPGVNPPFTTPAMSNQCFTTNLSGTYTLYMSPAGSCAPLTRIIASTITPAPLLLASVQQASCGSTSAVITLTPSGSAAVPSSITWSPAPSSPGNPSLTATYPIPTGINPPPLIVTVTATDPLGCKVSVTPSVYPAAPIPTFTITNVSGSPSITCRVPQVHLAATSTYTYGTLSYTFQSASTYSPGEQEILVGTPGTFTVTAEDPVSHCVVTHTYAVGINTIAPTGTITPSLQNITCLTSAQTVSASMSPTINASHHITSPLGNSFSAASHTVVYNSNYPGVYIDTMRNDLTGCYIIKNFTITSSDNFPTLSVSSLNNYTVGCNTHSTTTVLIGGDTQPSGGAVTYTILSPSFPPGGSYTPGSQSTYTFSTPGPYTAVIKATVGGCQTKIPFSVVQNTTQPDIHYSIVQPILNCDIHTTTLTAITANTNVVFAWTSPSNSGPVTVTSPTVSASITSSVTNPVAGNYTLTLSDNNNGCVSTTVALVQQNLFPPTPVLVFGSSNHSITCATQSLQLTNQSVTGITSGSGFPVNQNVVADWTGPTPMAPAFSVANYTAQVPGTYTMVAHDLNNGCRSTTTALVGDNRLYPAITTPTAHIIDCNAGTGSDTLHTVVDGVKDNTTNRHYQWYPPSTFNGTTTTKPYLLTNLPGEYPYVVTNTDNGCNSHGEVLVTKGSLDASFTSDHTSGYAPLNVTFNNTSHSSNSGNGTANITTVWSFGNCTTLTVTPTSGTFGSCNGPVLTTSTVPTPTALYTQAGTYQVTIYSYKGACSDTAIRYVSVDIPSKLEVPNVFTPNGDGVNDLFFLKVSNLTEIDAFIYDRWGRKVFELSSATGNIAWDGMTLTGQKASAGVYFYTIKGTGKDGKTYNEKGTISLFR